jgi:hypothetical protein
VAGAITHLRFYRSRNEVGTNTVNLWAGAWDPDFQTPKRSVSFAYDGTEGWHEQVLATPFCISAGSVADHWYWASYNVNAYARETPGAMGCVQFGPPITNGALTTFCGGYSDTAGTFPEVHPVYTNYFADIVFQPGAPQCNPTATFTSTPTFTRTWTPTSPPTATRTFTPTTPPTLTFTPSVTPVTRR